MNYQNNILIYMVIFLVVFCPYVFLSFFMNKPKITGKNTNTQNLPTLYKYLQGLLACFSESIGSISESLQPKRKIKMQNMLIVANIKMDVNYIFAAEIVLGLSMAIVSVLLFMLLTTDGIVLSLIGIVFGFIGFIYPSMIIVSAADKRQTAIMRALPFAIDLIGSAMRSGIDFTAAIRYYVSTENTDTPLAVEFGILLRQLELGKTRMEAIETMSRRIQTDAFSAFASAIIHGIEVGASIVETMKIQAEEMRRVRFNIAERKAARAVSAMIFPIAVFIMPAMFLIIGAPILIKVMGSGLGGLMQ